MAAGYHLGATRETKSHEENPVGIRVVGEATAAAAEMKIYAQRVRQGIRTLGTRPADA